jgi:hypothetical protein
MKKLRILFLALLCFLLFSTAYAGLLFDGVDDQVTCGRVIEIESVSAFSSSVWFKQDTLDVRGWLYNKGSFTVLAKTLSLFTYDDGNLYVEVHGNTNRGYLDYSAYVTAGEWAHLGVVFDGGGAANSDRLKLYINGVQRTLTYGGTIPATTTDSIANLLLGHIDTGAADLRYDDYLGSIALWDTDLSATEMAYLGGSRTRLMPSQVQPANLVLYYLINEGPDGTSADGDNLRDSSDSGNTGTGSDGANNTGLDWQAEQVLSYP